MVRITIILQSATLRKHLPLMLWFSDKNHKAPAYPIKSLTSKVKMGAHTQP